MIKNEFLINRFDQMRKILVIAFLVLGSEVSGEACPEWIVCETPVTPESCPQGTFYREKVKVYGCCPGCQSSLKGKGDPCDRPEDCQPGLTCNTNKNCEDDSSQACEQYKLNDPIWKKNKYWKPVCKLDGTFAPKQCKGEKMSGKCFCVSPQGRRVFGEEEWSASQGMSCGCSRMVDTMSKEESEVSFHCNLVGNFEPLQCQEKLCWCSNPSTGIPYSVMVPVQMMTSLPCYRRNAVGAQYHRQCDSADHIQAVTKALLRNHGTTTVTFIQPHCNFDGSYHRVQNLREKNRCVYRNNSPLTEAISSDNPNCNCAYDRYIAAQRQTDFLPDCLPNGNYRTRQLWNGKVYCLDQDGFQFSDDPNDCPVA